MRGFFESLFGLFSSLMYGGADEAQKHREMKKIWSRLQASSPEVFRAPHGGVLPGFASRVRAVSQALAPLAQLAGATVANPDTRIAERYRRFLVEAGLDPQTLASRSSFSYAGMKETLSGVTNADERLRAIDRDVDRFRKAFSDSRFNGFDQSLSDFLAWCDLATHDFQPLLGRFGAPEAASEGARAAPEGARGARAASEAASEGARGARGARAASTDVLTELEDLLYVIQRARITSGVTGHFQALASRMKEGEQAAAKLIHRLSQIAQLIETRLPPQMLLDLIRAVASDPARKPPVSDGAGPHLDTYLSELASEYSRDRERILRELSDDAVAKDLRALFENAELIDLQYYNEKESQILEESDFVGFTQVKPIRILKSFILAKFSASIRDTTKKILVDGFFEDTGFQTGLSSALFSCDQILEKVDGFDESMLSSQGHSLEAIRRYVDAHRSGQNVTAPLSHVVEQINTAAAGVVEDASSRLSKLAHLLGEIIGDYKQPHPTKITNIRVIGGERNRVIMASLVDGYNGISRFIRIMKRFTVVDAAELARAVQATREEQQ